MHISHYISQPHTLAGLLYIQNGDSLSDLSGFVNLVHVDTLVLALLGQSVTDIAGFPSLHSASRVYITRNSVSLAVEPLMDILGHVILSIIES